MTQYGPRVSVGFTPAQASAILPIVESNVAATGSAITDGQALVGDVCQVTGADGSKGVLLRAGSIERCRQVVINAAASALKVYPPTSTGKIDAMTPGAAISLSAGQMATFHLVNANNGEYFGQY